MAAVGLHDAPGLCDWLFVNWRTGERANGRARDGEADEAQA
jgi:hypothetical protein